MKASLRVPDLENLKISSSPSELSSMGTKLGRGRGLAITFKNEYLNNGMYTAWCKLNFILIIWLSYSKG